MPAEIEVKIAVRSAAAARRTIREAGFKVHIRRLFEANVIYDRAAQPLRAAGKLIRLRQAGKTCTLTFKGKPVNARHKIREEVETTLSRHDAMDRILRELDLQPVFRYEKYRTEFTGDYPHAVITLDETPIGVFLELEGPARWIDRTARRLGFTPADYITLSYGGLYLAWCREHQIQASNMTF
jgi:adenylate cyclase class 2